MDDSQMRLRGTRGSAEVPGLLLGKPLAKSPRDWRQRRGPELFDVPIVREEPIPVDGEDHTHLTARETGGHELRGVPDARGPYRHGKGTRLPAHFDGQTYQSVQPSDGSPGGEDAMGKK